MITIIIPTVSRPQMLRTALASVAEQTAVDKIERVYVSENGGSRESEKVCAEFPTLPITYVFRVPMKPLEHAQVMHREFLTGEFTAYLHDDDWWAPSHLKNALDTLESHPHAGAYAASHFTVTGESSHLGCSDNSFAWFGSNYSPLKSIWELTRLNVLMAELLNTMAHYSTIVARTEILKKAAYVFDLGNPFDNDRMLIFAMSTFASIAYNPMPEAFIRNHPAQDCCSYKFKKIIKHQSETTRWLVESSGRSWEMVAACFAKRLALCPIESVPTLRALAVRQWSLPELFRNIKGPLEVNVECLRKLRHIFEPMKARKSARRVKDPLSVPLVPEKNWINHTPTQTLELQAA